jgi:transposase
VVLAVDEIELSLFPPVRSSWSRVRKPQEVLLSGANEKRFLFGSLNVRTGHRLSVVRERQRGIDFQAFLEVVHARYRGWHPVLLLDENSSHTAKASALLAARYGIRLAWLPARSPHLNPMDHLWRYVKGVALADRQYATMEDVVAHALNYFHRLPSREALRKAGVLSPGFWLRTWTVKSL